MIQKLLDYLFAGLLESDCKHFKKRQSTKKIYVG